LSRTDALSLLTVTVNVRRSLQWQTGQQYAERQAAYAWN
jgi:hypothetical protein